MGGFNVLGMETREREPILMHNPKPTVKDYILGYYVKNT